MSITTLVPVSEVNGGAEGVVEKSWFKLVARLAMWVAGVTMPALAFAAFNMWATLERLTASNIVMKTELIARIDTTESRIEARLRPLENRQDGQTARLRDHDSAFVALTDKMTALTVQVAVLVERNNALVERINVLISLNSRQPQTSGGSR